MLRTEPSFSIYNNDEDGVVGVEGDNDNKINGCLNLETIGSGDFSFGKKGMELIQENDEDKEKELNDDDDVLNGFKNLGLEEIVRPVSPPMYLATGFGMDGNGLGVDVGVDFKCFDEGVDEECYRRMVSEDPCNPMVLKNYAKLLQSKGDLSGAEDFFLRATLADPNDGEVLLQYAKLIWEVHHDQERALSYFECAARAAPEDSHVLAAYASFLWEIDGDGEEDFHACADHVQVKDGIEVNLQDLPHKEGPVSLNFGESVNIEEYYNRMLEENSCDPLFLRNYAQFVYQKSKGDPKGAEEYYSRAILANPEDGEIISQYANLVWELYHDHDKALSYFERAVQASPRDSHVLAAYARFLWITEDDEDE